MLFSNVKIDDKSAFGLTSMVQKNFYLDMFRALSAIMGQEFEKYTFFIYNSNDVTSIPASAALAGERKVLLFLTDESAGCPDHLTASYTHIFKTHFDRDSHGNIHPLNLGMPDSRDPAVRPMAERSIDIFFQGNLNLNRLVLYRQFNPFFRLLPPGPARFLLRVLLRSGLARLLPLRYVGARKGHRYHVVFTLGFMKGLAVDEYQQLLADSRVALCPAGFVSNECFRHSEALRAGCAALSQQLPDTAYYRDSPFLIAAEWQSGLALAERLLDDPQHLAALQRDGLAWYDAKMSPQGTARYIAGKLGWPA